MFRGLSFKWVFWGILLAALLLRIGYVITLDQHTITYWDDQGWEIAKNMVEGNGYKMSWIADVYSARPPVFPLFLFGIFSIFGQSLLIVRIFLAICNSLICVAVYFLAKEMFDRKVALLAMAITAVFPSVVYWSGYISQETLTTLFFTTVLIFIFKIKQKPLFYSLLSGLALGMLVMTRSLAYGILPIIFIWLYVNIKSKKKAFISVCLISLMVMLLITPWVARNFIRHHGLLITSTEGGLTFYLANNPEVLIKGGGDTYMPDNFTKGTESMPEIEKDRYFLKKGIEFVKTYPRMYIRLVLERFIRFWRFYPHITGAIDSHKPIHLIIMFFTDTPLILLGFFGLIAYFRDDKERAVLLALLFLYFTIIAMLIYSCIRYRAPLLPLLIILSSFFIVSKLKKLRILRNV
ncbi:MAG: glycosyltransferase family 39 protein [Candidatus Omnitrophica bacterium]|nr:glycosyltransferase family 39 protein [Candidatus Omnitrophota bacterium]